MKTLARSLAGATVISVRTSTGLVTRGGPGVVTERRGGWEIIVDDFERGTVSPSRLRRILADATRDPVEAVLRHFDAASSEVFALCGPPGVIAGSGPRTPGRAAISVLVEPAEGVVAVGFADQVGDEAGGWLALPSGIAVCWGPMGPEVYCDLVSGTTGVWGGSS